MCGYCCIGFIDFMLKVKSLLDYTNLFFYNDFLILASTITGYISNLLGVPIDYTISAIGLKNCAIAAGIKKYN